jgi:hypothetical protein
MKEFVEDRDANDAGSTLVDTQFLLAALTFDQSQMFGADRPLIHERVAGPVADDKVPMTLEVRVVDKSNSTQKGQLHGRQQLFLAK